MHYELTLGEDFENEKFRDEYKYFTFLRRLNLVTYDYIKLNKENKQYNIFDSSSGEIGLLISLLRAIPNIKDGSVILIDEPEISLHPAWQMRYITLLKDFLSFVKGCHVIIASHSHFLLSDLNQEWSSIVKIYRFDGRVLGKSIEYTPYGWSPEAILYQVFGVANVRNQYLETDLRNMLKLISSESKDFESIRKYVSTLKSFEFREGDPLELIIEEAEKYLSEHE